MQISVPPLPVALAGPPDRAAPWWRFGIVWLVVGGPVTVVIAGIATTVLAFHGADPPVPELRPTAVEALAAPGRATAPALQVRNHAATPSR